jgi:stress-induced morphogen
MSLRSFGLAGKRYMSAMAQSMTPMEDALQSKVGATHQIAQVMSGIRLTVEQITKALKPTTLEIFNDSHKHAHHKAMQGVTSREVIPPPHWRDIR